VEAVRFSSPNFPRGRAVRPSELPNTRITARADDENKLEIRFLREARESLALGQPAH
jgi:hypothetical protein